MTARGSPTRLLVGVADRQGGQLDESSGVRLGKPGLAPHLSCAVTTVRLIRYDERGTGLSDRDVADVSFDAWVSDLEAVVDAIDLRLRAALDFAGRRCFCWIRDPGILPTSAT